MLDLLRSPVEPSSYTMEKLRKLLSDAIRESMGMWLYQIKLVTPIQSYILTAFYF